ncbi:uncharacterized N-acetyltransferase C9.02c-like [Acanthaster planci]|uniref:Serotonin N-acetyltransferase n=1 Tax=Acanthaster planci TaxID=133434 RepID=A0A8B7ZBQ4_ACAPL|nr:uncharacterized N-acetyltransferase C9.02c-like [Acanthaster planci]
MALSNVCIRPVTEKEVHDAWLIESLSFSSEEGASEETCKFRQRVAPELFWGYFENDRLIAITHGTKTSLSKLTRESMFTHDPEGTVVGVHSLCTHPEHRKKGVAKALMQQFIQYVRDDLVNITKICLVSHDFLVPFYEGLGYKCEGLSQVTFGPDPWYDMVHNLPTDSRPWISRWTQAANQHSSPATDGLKLVPLTRHAQLPNIMLSPATAHLPRVLCQHVKINTPTTVCVSRCRHNEWVASAIRLRHNSME